MRNLALSFRFARRELRAGLAGFYVFLACLVLGVGAIAGVQSLSKSLVDSLRHDGRYILGGDLAFRSLYARPPEAQIAAIRHLGNVSEVAHVRGMARRADEAQATMIELKAVDAAYPLYGAMQLEDAAGQPLDNLPSLLAPRDGRPGAVVEKSLLSRLGIAAGDMLRVGEGEFEVRGIIRKEPDRISVETYSFAPRVMIPLSAFVATGLGAAGSQVYYTQRVALPQAESRAGLAAIEKRLEKEFPEARWRVRNSFKASPRIEEYIDRLAFFLTLISLTTLLVGGVGISNAVRGYLDSRLSDIATLKCLGASGRFVFRLYMLQILALSALGIALGLILGAAGAKAAGKLLTARLVVTDLSNVYPEALLLAAGFGLLTAIAFSLWPVGRAVKTAPNALFRDRILPGGQRPSRAVRLGAIVAAELLALLAVATASDPIFALWFAVGAAAAFAVFWSYAAALKSLLRRLRLKGRPLLRMAVANLHRPGNAATSIVLSLGIGLTVLSAVALVEYNFSRLVAEDLGEDAPSFFFLDIPPDGKEAFVKMMHSFPGMRDLVITPSFRGRIAKVNGVPAEQALVDKSQDWVIRSDRGFTYTSDLPRHSRITAGGWWPKEYKGPPIVSIASDVARAFDIGPGDTLTLSVLGLDIDARVANVRDIEWTSFTMNFAVTFAPGPLDDAPATWLATAILDPGEEEAAQARLAREFPGVTAVRVREALETAGTVVEAVAQAIRIGAGVTLLAGSLVMAGGVAAARRRHVYDAVVLKVLGAEKRRIMATFLLEYGIMGGMTVLIAAALGTLASFGMLLKLTALHWKFSALPLLSVAGLCLGVALLAGFSGTWRALRQKPAAYLRAQ
jgi:putative ABC transport system permease protein